PNAAGSPAARNASAAPAWPGDLPIPSNGTPIMSIRALLVVSSAVAGIPITCSQPSRTSRTRFYDEYHRKISRVTQVGAGIGSRGSWRPADLIIYRSVAVP